MNIFSMLPIGAIVGQLLNALPNEVKKVIDFIGITKNDRIERVIKEKSLPVVEMMEMGTNLLIVLEPHIANVINHLSAVNQCQTEVAFFVEGEKTVMVKFTMVGMDTDPFVFTITQLSEVANMYANEPIKPKLIG
ncbi:MAG: hypothetical protein RLZZ175_2758 [Bacteroidota bacterium]|jgi:hypothetical protein